MLKAKLKRSKLFSFFISIFILLNLTSCEGFFTDNNLDQKIRAAIDYANAPTSSFWIAADATAGTINPIGKISYKPTDYQNIKFKLKPEYQFIRWNFRYEEIQSSEKYQKEITNQNWWKDYIEIVNEEISEPGSNGEITYSLQIKFIKAEENMLIEPVCALKPILKSWSGQLGDVQSRNGSLSFVFNTKLDLDASIYFSSAELAALGTVTPLTNGLGKVYGYVKDDETFFKNIEIKYKNRSINSSYKDFRYNSDTNTLVIASDSTHTFDIVGDFADIEVIFKEGIKSEAQASMTEAKAYININKYSDDRSVINIVTNTAKNPETVNIVSQNLYLQEQKTATFVESDLTQFLYWEVTSNPNYPDSKDKVYTEIDEENPNKLTYWGMQKIDSTEEVTITAVFEYRPQVVSYTPNSQSVVPKDSDIQINFDEEINLQSFIDGYKISCSGDPVTNYFKTPVLSADKKSIIITADLENRLPIDSNKPITVTVPGSLYYEKTESDGEKYHITLGQDKQLSYTVNPSTRDKAYIQFNVDTSQISIDNFNAASVKTYSIGDIQTIVCNEKSGYQFLGWVKTNDAGDAIDVIKVSDSSYTFKILKACGTVDSPIIVTSNSKERLAASLFDPVMKNDGVEKDSDIYIDFNHAPSLAACKENISVLYNGINLNETSFPVELWESPVEETANGKTVYRLKIPANFGNRLEVNGVGTIEIKIDEGLYYTEGQSKVYYKPKGETLKYKVNNSTRNKAYVKFETGTGKGSVKSGGKNFEISNVKTYNIGEEVTLSFEEVSNYQFFNWQKENDSNNAVIITQSDTNSKVFTFSISKAAGSLEAPVTITANVKERLRVNKITPVNNDTGVVKDSDIYIYFNHAPNLEICKQKIAIKCNGINVKDDSFPPENWEMSNSPTADGYRLKIPANTDKRLNINDISTVNVSFDANLYYIDGTDFVYYGGNGYSYDYKVNTETGLKANLTFAIDDENSGVLTPSTGSQAYSVGNEIELNFVLANGYEFNGWQILDTSGNELSSSVIEIAKKNSLTTTIKIKVAQAAIIKPKVTLLPSIINALPELSTGAIRCDSIIRITFNKPMDESTLILGENESIQIYDYTNETIHYENYFNEPVWEDNTLIIKPKNTINTIFTSITDIKLIKVKLDKDTIQDVSGHYLQKDYSWYYKIDRSMEAKVPVVDAINLYKPKYSKGQRTHFSINYLMRNYEELSSLSFDEFKDNASKMKQNHVGNEIIFTCSVHDKDFEDSGFKNLTIKETLVNDISGNPINKEYEPTVYEYTDSVFVCEENVYSIELLSLDTEESYTFKTNYDGLVRLDFIFTDFANNPTTKTFYVIKDTNILSDVVLNPKHINIGESSSLEVVKYLCDIEGVTDSYGNNLYGKPVSSYLFQGGYQNLSGEAISDFNALTPSAGFVTQKIDLSDCLDTFYDEIGTTPTYEVKWGYAQNSLQEVSGTNRVYQFERDVTKDCFIQITAYDSVGNSKTITRVIPRQLSIDSTTSTTFYQATGQSSDYGPLERLNIPNIEYIQKFANQYGAENLYCYFMYKYKDKDGNLSDKIHLCINYSSKFECSDFKYTIFFFKQSKYLSDAALTPDGTYYFYVLPYFKYGERKYFGALSEPYVYYHNVEPETSSSLETPALPTSINVTTNKFGENNTNTGINTGVINVVTTYPFTFTQTEGFTYGIKYSRAGYSHFQYAGLNFYLPSGLKYDLYVYAKNNETNELFSSEKLKTIDLTTDEFDNIPPHFTQDFAEMQRQFYRWQNPGQMVFNTCDYNENPGLNVNNSPKDDVSGLFENENGEKEVEYYVIKKDMQTVDINDYTLSDLTNLNIQPYKAIMYNNALTLDFNSFFESYYSFVINLKDKKGNYKLCNFTVSSYISPRLITLELTDGPVIQLYSWRTGPGEDGKNASWSTATCFLENNEWHLYQSYHGYVKKFNKGFYRVSDALYNNTSNHKNSSISGYVEFTPYVYFYGDYYQKIIDGENPVCNKKGVIPGYGNSYQVFFDAPCFAHTMAFPTSMLDEIEAKTNLALYYDSTRNYDDVLAAMWETKGREFGLEVLSETWTSDNKTYTVPLQQIPDDCSYVTIFHFADGTVVMTDVKQK